MSTNYYDILQINKDASEQDIHRAYKKIARDNHPDKHRSSEKEEKEYTERFQKIGRAYEVLKDKNTRSTYDQFGEEGLTSGHGGMGGMGGMDINAAMRAAMGMGMGMHAGGTPQPELIQIQVPISLKDSYCGKRMSVKVKIRDICNTCDGKGTADKKDSGVCTGCKGNGVKQVIRQVGPGMVQQMMIPCEECKGLRYKVEEKNKCITCGGKRLREKTNEIKIEIEPGVLNQHVINCHGVGHKMPGATSATTLSGDVQIVLSETASNDVDSKGIDNLVRDQQVPCNLKCEKTISLLDALIGFEFSFLHLDGKPVIFKSPKDHILANGEYAVLQNFGMPIRKTEKFGDLYIKFNVKMPQASDIQKPKTIALFKKVLSSMPVAGPVSIYSEEMRHPEPSVWNEETMLHKMQQKLQEMSQDDEDEDEGKGAHGAQQCRQM
jgi:DnaJ family protein A protein 2